MVGVFDAERFADLLQAGKHDVDGECIQRHQRRHHCNEFSFADALKARRRIL
ncbi:hypothetical protein D3C86_2084730 [compost metagenome]